MVAPRATTKKSKALIFEAADSIAECTIADVGAGCCAVEVQATSIRATYRATPIEAVSAHIAERATVVKAVTWNGKLQG